MVRSDDYEDEYYAPFDYGNEYDPDPNPYTPDPFASDPYVPDDPRSTTQDTREDPNADYNPIPSYDPGLVYQNSPQRPGADITWGSLNPPQNVTGGWWDSHTGGFIPANGGNAAGYMDLSYWASRGIPADQIFDFSTGQLKPGWKRTGNGYEKVVATNTPTTNTNLPDKLPTTYGGLPNLLSGNGFVMPNLSASPRANFGPVPQFNAPPEFVAPTWTPPPEFAYSKGDFKAPTTADMMADPSYQFRLAQGTRALEQSAAGKGLLRTSGTLKDLINYGSQYASQEYGNVYNRKFGEYKFDYDKEADTYEKNYTRSKDLFDTTYGGKKDEYTSQYQTAKDKYAPSLTEWTTNASAAQRAAELQFQREFDLAKFDYLQKQDAMNNTLNYYKILFGDDEDEG